MVSLRESASSFFPALVVLSGARRGNTEFLADDTVQINVSSKGAAQLIGVSAGEPVFDLPAGFRHLATLERRGSTYELRSTPGSLVWINGEQVYDTDTTYGGSGGPVLGLDGNVVAVNAAILPEFGGSNLGVPASEARRLIEAARER